MEESLIWLGSSLGEAALYICIALFAIIAGGILLSNHNTYKHER